MSRHTPTVAADALYDPATPATRIRLDSPAWHAWLAAPSTTCFAYPLHDQRRGYIAGFMTVRKEGRRRGGAYWTVYRRVGAQVRKVYLGRSAAVTQDRLEAIAQGLLAEAIMRKEGSTMDTS